MDHLADDLVGSGLSGSLRYCITNAVDGDDVQFAVTGTINLSGPLPNLSHSINIAGPGPDQLTVRRDTGGYYRIFTIGSLATASISGITVTNGWLANDQQGGGGILNYGSLAITNARIFENLSINAAGTYNDWGGGIANYGTLAVSFSTVSENAAECDDPKLLIAGGGGIWNGGTLTVSFSSFLNNQAASFYRDLDILDSGGGAIFNIGDLTISNSTFAYNAAGGGGALLNFFLNPGTITIDNSTISHNMAETDPYVSSGGGIAGNVLHARNTIIAGNTGGGYVGAQDIYGGLGSLGHNLIGNTQGGSGFDPTDLLNVDPLLGPLQDNGGPTKTMALLPGSPAIDAGDNTGAPDWDQRGPGFPRIVNGIIDVGAFEVQGGGSGPGRSGSLHAKAVHLDVAALLPLAISPSPASFSGPGSLNAQPQDTVAGQHATIVDRLFASLDKDSAFAWAQRKLVAPSEVSSNQALGGLGDGAGEEKEDAASFLI